MIKNYFKIAIRNLYRNKVYSLISILGLAVGLCATILLFLYIRMELSYDNHFRDSQKIYRVLSHSARNGEQVVDMPITTYDIADYVLATMPKVESATRFTSKLNFEIKQNNNSKGFYKCIYTDSLFFNVFSFKPISGDLLTALREPNKVVLTRNTAEKIFGDIDVLGQTIQVQGTYKVVSAVIEDIPENTHLKFDMLISINSLKVAGLKKQGNNFYVYLKLKHALTEDLNLKITGSISEFVNESFKEYEIEYFHSLQPLKKIHLHSDKLSFDVAETGSVQYIYIFSILALFIIAVAIFNYINLFTSKSETRAREVGVRKVNGATKISLIKQFIGESIIISTISFLIAMLLVESFIYPFGNLVNRTISFLYFDNIDLLVCFFLTSILVGILSGIYPSLYISRFNSVEILKGSFLGRNKNKLNFTLVVLQFSIVIALISSLFVLYSQVLFMKSKEKGFDKEQVVTFQNLSKGIYQNFESIKNEMLKCPDIIFVTASQSVPGEGRSGYNIRLPEWPLDEAIPIHENRVDNDYVKTMGFELIQGEDFSEKLTSDSTSFILNESAAKLLNLENPVGVEVYIWINKGRVVGVVKDFHYESMHKKIEPLVLSYYSRKRFHNLSIRLNSGRIKEGLSFAQETFSKFDPYYTANYKFLDQIFDKMYTNEEKSNKLIFVASLLAIIISVLGLLALTSFIVSRRTKEIGIRKALGSNVKLILVLLNKDILKWILISSFIGIPASYYFMKNWLNNFAYKIDLNIWFFGLALVIALVIAFITISVQSYKTAKKNPIESLRYE